MITTASHAAVGGEIPPSSTSFSTALTLRTWPTRKAAVSKTARCRSITCRPCQFSRERSVVSLHGSLKPSRCWCDSNPSHHFSLWQEAGSPAVGLISRHFRCNSGSCSQFLEHSLAARHSAWDRDDAGATPAAPTKFPQVRGSVSGAPAREAGEAGASPAHLTIAA